MAEVLSSIGILVKLDGEEISGVTDIPELAVAPEKLEVTTLKDTSKKYITGLKDYGDLEFTLLYESGSEGNYAKLKAKENQAVAITVELPDESTFTINGSFVLKFSSASVGAVLTFAMVVSPSEEIEFTQGS